MTYEEMSEHIDGTLTDEMFAYANELFQHFAFLYREKVTLRDAPYEQGKRVNMQFAHCTKCHSEWETGGSYKTGAHLVCPKCYQDLLCKNEGRKRTSLVQESGLLWFFPSLKDRESVGAVFFHCVFDLTRDFRRARPRLIPRSMYLFRCGQGAEMYKRSVCYCAKPRKYCGFWGEVEQTGGGYCAGKWVPQKNISYGVPSQWQNQWSWGEYLKKTINGASLIDAVTGTPFARCGFTERKEMRENALESLALAAKYPCVEYLHKAGLDLVIEDRINNRHMHRAIQWNGKTMQKVTGLTPQDAKKARRMNIDIDALMLAMLRAARKVRPETGIEDIAALRNRMRTLSDENMIRAAQLVQYGTLETWNAYIDAQSQSTYAEMKYQNVMGDLLDYIGECIKLKLDMTDSAILRPKNLLEAHARTAAQIRVLADTAAEKRCAARAEKLKEYRFEENGLMLFPAASAADIVYEGKMLRHCVGGYVESYANGKTIICFLRKQDAPDTPWHTVEFSTKDGHMVQCRGQGNQSTAEDMKLLPAFWDAFNAHRAAQSKNESKKARKTA